MIVGYLVTCNRNGFPALPGEDDVHTEFWCKQCATPCDKTVPVPEHNIPVHEVNIKPYSQTCKACGKKVVDGLDIELF